jgi:predicted kinase
VTHRATLVYLYGPPAVGKLTVATQLGRRTGFRLFHNHLTVNAMRSVFEFGSAGFTEVLHRVRLDVFVTAARNGIDVIFTNNSAWAPPDGRRRFAAFAEDARARVASAGGRTLFVRLTAPTEVLRARVDAQSRHEHGKLVDRERLDELLASHDPRSLHHDDVVVDTSTTAPDEAAALIAAACR